MSKHSTQLLATTPTQPQVRCYSSHPPHVKVTLPALSHGRKKKETRLAKEIFSVRLRQTRPRWALRRLKRVIWLKYSLRLAQGTFLLANSSVS